MDFPGLEPKKMTDDELLRKVSDLNGKLLAAYSMGMAQEMQDQIRAMLESLEFEQSDRMQRRIWDMQQRQSAKVIETEPDLVEKKQEVVTTKTKIRAGVGVGGVLRRSKSPSSNQP